jgi:hypothetical protein
LISDEQKNQGWQGSGLYLKPSAKSETLPVVAETTARVRRHEQIPHQLTTLTVFRFSEWLWQQRHSAVVAPEELFQCSLERFSSEVLLFFCSLLAAFLFNSTSNYGVTKFSKVSIFSGINQLMDMTLDDNYATICGYTQTDLETSFADHLAGVDWGKLKHWYNGYNFCGDVVYNPFDILLFISENQTYRNYWFETGSPSFLIKLFQQNRYFLPDLEDIEVGEEILDSFDIENIDPITLLFQSGYLTIDKVIRVADEIAYRLTIPNHEVQTALYNQFSSDYSGIGAQRLAYKSALVKALQSANLPELIATIKRLFASIPWRNFTQNSPQSLFAKGGSIADAEGYYASVLYAFFASLNATCPVTAQGAIASALRRSANPQHAVDRSTGPRTIHRSIAQWIVLDTLTKRLIIQTLCSVAKVLPTHRG